jgi:hypothetical protein
MPHTVTITGKTGPNRTNTAIALSAVDRVDFDLKGGKVQVYIQNQAGNQIKEYELAGITAVTVTITAGQYAFVVS